MLTVACVLRSGGIYDGSWVVRLAAGVAQHLRTPHEFVCLTDHVVPMADTDGRVRWQVRDLWPGWWSKIELFSFPGPLLYFDLDTLIVGDLADIALQAETHRFIMLRDFYRPNGLGSGMMAWSAKGSSYVRNITALFRQQPEHFMRTVSGGDQAFVQSAVNLSDVSRWQDVVPGQVVSYKVDKCEQARPQNARVVCLHGKPKFADMKPDCWVRREWEALK